MTEGNKALPARADSPRALIAQQGELLRERTAEIARLHERVTAFESCFTVTFDELNTPTINVHSDRLLALLT